MKKYKALMLDLDGTTVPNSPTGMPSPKVVEAIRKAQEKLFVCIVTGRFLFETEPILDVLKIDTPVILQSGAQIVDAQSRKFIYSKSIEKQDIRPVLELISSYKTFKRPIEIHEENSVIEYTTSYIAKSPINIFLPGLTEKEVDELTNLVSHRPDITTTKVLSWTHGQFCLSISHVSATKQHAVFEVAKMLGIETHEMIGVGEGPNDFPLLMACGLKVAMGNAVEDVKAIADYIAPSVDEDGVAHVINTFVLV